MSRGLQLAAQGIMVAMDTTITQILAELSILDKKLAENTTDDVNFLSSQFFHRSLIGVKLKFCSDNIAPIKESLEKAMQADRSLFQPYQFCIIAQETLTKLAVQNHEKVKQIENIVDHIVPENAVVH
jgi:hypothetical protein